MADARDGVDIEVGTHGAQLASAAGVFGSVAGKNRAVAKGVIGIDCRHCIRLCIGISGKRIVVVFGRIIVFGLVQCGDGLIEAVGDYDSRQVERLGIAVGRETRARLLSRAVGVIHHQIIVVGLAIERPSGELCGCELHLRGVGAAIEINLAGTQQNVV